VAARSDDFNRTGSPNLHGSTPSDGGSAWVEEVTGAIKTDTDGVSGRVIAYRLDAPRAAWLESSVTDHEVSGKPITALDDVGVIGRVQDASNYYLLRVAGGGNPVELYKQVATAYTLLDTGTTGVVSGDTLKISCNGSTIKGYVNGVEEVSVTDSSLTTGTKVGIRIRGYIDDFASADVGGAPAGHPALRRLGLVAHCRPAEIGREGVRVF
jgi:hypothetical protein